MCSVFGPCTPHAALLLCSLAAEFPSQILFYVVNKPPAATVSSD